MEQLFLYCQQWPTKDPKVWLLTVNLQVDELVLFIGHCFDPPFTPQKKFLLPDELYQLLLTLPRLPIPTKKTTVWAIIRPDTYPIAATELLACLQKEVRLRRLRALLN